MIKKHLTLSKLLFTIFIVALIFPKTRIAMQVAVNKVRVFVMSPSKLSQERQTQLQPFTYQLTTLDGEEVEMAVGQGKVAFISYWATWCPSCVAEMPSIVKLHEDYGDKINFLLLTNEKPEKVKAFLNKKGYNLPVYKPRMKNPKYLNAGSIPTNYLLSKSGKLIIKEIGANDWNSDEVRSLIDAAL